MDDAPVSLGKYAGLDCPYDGMYLGFNHLKRALSGRWALLVLSDGGDNNSRYKESEMRRLVRESEFLGFAIL